MSQSFNKPWKLPTCWMCHWLNYWLWCICSYLSSNSYFTLYISNHGCLYLFLKILLVSNTFLSWFPWQLFLLAFFLPVWLGNGKSRDVGIMPFPSVLHGFLLQCFYFLGLVHTLLTWVHMWFIITYFFRGYL